MEVDPTSMNPEYILALISDLYAQVAQLTVKNHELQTTLTTLQETKEDPHE